MTDGDRCVAILEARPGGDGAGGAEAPGTRFQLHDRLGSVSLELDAAAAIVSYEEFFPFGGTALIAGPDRQQVSLKDDRYTGKERDDSTGLCYFGARYHVPWLGRWLNPDPAGRVDGPNLYQFALDNPTTLVDRDGRHTTVVRVPGRNGRPPTLRIHTTGVLVDHAGHGYTPQQMRGFARRLERQISRSYRLAGGPVRVVGSARIRASTRVHPRDHVFRLTTAGLGLPGGAIGYAPSIRLGVGGPKQRQRVVYILHTLTPHTPATAGPHAGTGRSVTYNATLERTGAHEIGHQLGLNHPAGAGVPANLMNQTGVPVGGLQITLPQALNIEAEHAAGRLNGPNQV